ncbi:MAG: flagellar basal body rod protein FlgB [Lachnospiraceae bacterium]|nr:flagellar basal body rod protein FlgB [Lachnospiraceae bacterium]
MFSSNAFNYINILDKAADASALRGKAINNNLANADTPNYKRQDVDFESVLQRELGSYRSKYKSNASRVKRVNQNLENLEVGTYTDMVNYSYRLDRNNVDPDIENVELAANVEKYNGLIDGMTSEFERLKMVMK